ncbi:hypothetical protein ACHAWF_001957, partial [Thalassiosira exigua]
MSSRAQSSVGSPPVPSVPADAKSIQTNASTKAQEDFRTYDAETPERVREHYRDMRANQTVAFYEKMEEKYSFENGKYRRLMTIEEAFEELEEYVDASDPDLDLERTREQPNLLHLLQTAEGLRRAGHPDWLQLAGLLHDVGKIMFLWGASEDGQDGRSPNGKQWALGGDTFVVGCKIPDCTVFPEFNALNPDMNDERYNTECGIYERHCGLDELKFA